MCGKYVLEYNYMNVQIVRKNVLKKTLKYLLKLLTGINIMLNINNIYDLL